MKITVICWKSFPLYCRFQISFMCTRIQTVFLFIFLVCSFRNLGNHGPLHLLTGFKWQESELLMKGLYRQSMYTNEWQVKSFQYSISLVTCYHQTLLKSGESCIFCVNHYLCGVQSCYLFRVFRISRLGDFLEGSFRNRAILSWLWESIALYPEELQATGLI